MFHLVYAQYKGKYALQEKMWNTNYANNAKHHHDQLAK